MKRWKNCCNVRDLSVCCVPKAASTSLKAGLLHSAGVPVENIHGNAALNRTFPEDASGRLVAFIRHPWSRLVGTWRHRLHGERTAVTRGFEKRGFRQGMSLRDYLVRLPHVYDLDCHTAPQVRFVHADCELYLVERVNEGWRQLKEEHPWLHELPFYGKRYFEPVIEPGALGRAVLRQLYADDMELWESANSQIFT